jgi:hypothetical protein
MTTRRADDVASAIDQVERRIELRRARLLRHAAELREVARERAKPLPLIGVVAFAIAGFTLARGRPARGSTGIAAKTGVLAALVALVQTALRLSASPVARAGWNMYTRRHAPPP